MGGGIFGGPKNTRHRHAKQDSGALKFRRIFIGNARLRALWRGPVGANGRCAAYGAFTGRAPRARRD